MAEGWIKLHRKVLDCWIWQVKPYDKARAWVDLLLLVMHHDKKMVVEEKPITIERGSYFISRGKLADRWGWSIKKVDAYLKTLEKEKMVTTNRTRKGTIITIVNYEEYQIEGTTQDTTEDAPQDTTEDIPQDTPHGTSQGTQNKNIKNDKELKNINSLCKKDAQSLFEELWELYPVKKGKGQVSNAAKMRLFKIGKEEMIRAIDRYKSYVAKKINLSYQNGSTFFNSGYVDYIDKNYTPFDEEPKTSVNNKFNNFESRRYDMSLIEQQLLNN